jgi:diguanylate cyclase (GGDEF)-like protein
MTVVAIGIWIVALNTAPAPPSAPLHFPWPLLALLFGLAQISPLHVQAGRQYRSVSLTEAPFVLGLLFVSPGWFLLARVVGGVAAEIAARRQYRTPLKLAFNVNIFVAEAALGTALYRLLDRGHGVESGNAWFAVAVSATVVCVVTGLAVAILVELLDERVQWRRVTRAAGDAFLHAAAVASLGLTAALALLESVWAVIPLTVTLFVLVVAYRLYASLTDRHALLERLYGFAREMSNEQETAALTRTILTQATTILHAEQARLISIGGGGEIALAGSEAALQQPEHPWLEVGDGWILDQLVRRAQPLLIGRDSGDLAGRTWLARNGLREALLAPMHTGDEVPVALAVGDRIGDARGFGPADLGVLETLATQASVEYRNVRLLDQLRHESLHDAVTGAPNRAHLEAVLEHAIADQIAHNRGIVVLAMIGLGALPAVNDTFGHQRGDEVLREAVRRATEASAGYGRVFRFGGAELALLMGSADSLDQAMRDLSRLIDALSDAVVLDGARIDLAAHVGVASAPLDATAAGELIKCADIAMYAAKNDGQDLETYDPKLDAPSRDRLILAAALRRAVSNGEISIAVQPKARMGDRCVTGVEALARWNHPELGSIPPIEFTAIAEQTGLIRPLTEAVLNLAVEACAEWQGVAPGVGVAVNISVRALHTYDLEDLVERTAARHRLPLSLLTLEVTESSIMADPRGTGQLLRRLRERGIAVSIDDFGTGYSSLAHLRRLPVQELKIDREFVRTVTTDREDAAIVSAIVDLAHTLHLRVVAEGVEDAETWAVLADAGVDVGQGYHLARPLPVSEFVPWLRHHCESASAALDRAALT